MSDCKDYKNEGSHTDSRIDYQHFVLGKSDDIGINVSFYL